MKLNIDDAEIETLARSRQGVADVRLWPREIVEFCHRGLGLWRLSKVLGWPNGDQPQIMAPVSVAVLDEVESQYIGLKQVAS
jgi:hypothetical protein